MSVLQQPESMNTPNLQIWNNEAFDSETISSWCPIKPNSDSLDSDSTKENHKPLHSNATLQTNPKNSMSKQAVVDKAVLKTHQDNKIDEEIKEIEKEISLLSSRLQVLKLEKVGLNSKMFEKQTKFIEPKKSVTKVQRRGLSLGPSEIMSGVKFSQLGKQEITPIQSIQNRRKSCFWKLQDIEEGTVSKEGRKNLSLSPKSRKGPCKSGQASRQAVTTVGSRKGVKKEVFVIQSIQPKKLFKDGEKSVTTAKKPLKPGRVIASRYNQNSGTFSAMRKRSLPENDMDESKVGGKKRVSLETNRTESRVKKQWEIPSELVVVCSNLEAEKSPISIAALGDRLPKIRTFRCGNDTPRDSGPAKKVAELIGKKSYFCHDEEDEAKLLVCQTLSFAGEVEEK